MKRFGVVIGHVEGCNESGTSDFNNAENTVHSTLPSTLQDGILLSTVTSNDELTNLMNQRSSNNNSILLVTNASKANSSDSTNIPSASIPLTTDVNKSSTTQNIDSTNISNLINVTINNVSSKLDEEEWNQPSSLHSHTLLLSTLSVNVDQENYILRNSNNGSDDGGIDTNLDGDINSIFFLNNNVDEQYHDNDDDNENCINSNDTNTVEHNDSGENCCINCGEFFKDEESVNCAAVFINDCDYRLDISGLTNSSYSREFMPFLTPIVAWTNENVISWLDKMNLNKYIPTFKENTFKGSDLLNILTENDQQYEEIISFLNEFLLEQQHKKIEIKREKNHFKCQSCMKIMMVKSSIPKRYRHLCKQCNKCKIQPNCNCGILAQQNIPKENTNRTNFLTLCHQLIDVKLKIPILLLILINDIEFKLKNYKDNIFVYIDAILSTTNYYLITNMNSTQKLNDIDILWEKLIAAGILSTTDPPPVEVPNNTSTHSLFRINLHDYSLKCVVGVLKRFLCNLIDPVMSASWYNLFISAQNLKYRNERITSIFQLINQLLPPQHLTTLKYLMSHLCFIKSLLEQKKLLYKWDDILDIWCNIIIRPPTNKLFKIIENSDKHLNVLKILLMFGKWKCGSKDTKLIINMPNTSSIFLNQKKIQHLIDETEFLLDLYKEDWYFGHLTRQDCKYLLRNANDGTFIVRNTSTAMSNISIAPSIPSSMVRTRNYTLHLKNNNDCVIKILNYNNSTYGFTSDIQFSTIKELINFYKKNSLQQYNSELCIKLKDTISRDQSLQINKMYENTHNSEYSLNQQLDHIVFDNFFKLYCNWNIDAYGFQNLFSMDNLVTFSDLNRTFYSFVMLKYLVNTKMYTHECDYEKVQLYMLNVDRLKKNLMKISSYCIKPPNHLDGLSVVSPRMNQTQAMDVSIDIPHLDQSKWFLVNCSRVEAHELLGGKPPGTFLIRKRPCENSAQTSAANLNSPYALTLINYNNEINHCIIYQRVNNLHYGFAEPLMIFKTLLDLVLYYRDRSMEIHSSCLKIKLKYPLYS